MTTKKPRPSRQRTPEVIENQIRALEIQLLKKTESVSKQKSDWYALNGKLNNLKTELQQARWNEHLGK